MSLAEKLFGSFSDRELKKINPITKKVLALETKYQPMSDAELQAQTPALKERLANGETLDDILPDAFAVCREAAWRVLGMKHFLCRSWAALPCTAAPLPRCRPVKARPWWPPCPPT